MPVSDLDLTSADIRALGGADAVVALFARLGYNTNARLPQTAAAMGLTGDLAAAVSRIERVASQDGGLFEVYLLEGKNVTAERRNDLARALRDRATDFLLVLATPGYERLDFVLIERFTPEPAEGPTPVPRPGSLTVRVRPRVLSVARRAPDSPVVLRVLRRFTYTEADSFAQYDKLRGAYDVADWSEPLFNNRALFSDYYLKERLPGSPEWPARSGDAALAGAFKTLRGLYAEAPGSYANAETADLRRRLVEPVLAALGFTTQAGKASTPEQVEPDYRLYSGATAGAPVGVALAYRWNRNLDSRDDTRESGDAANENPGARAVALLEAGAAGWAVVTNGKLWRLYAAAAHSRATNYFEMDLEETLAFPDPDRQLAFAYFWTLFRAAAFAPAPRVVAGETRTLPFLDSLIAESERYARELEERLKDRVFAEIFPHFARGFVRDARRRGALPADLESRPEDERNRLLEPVFSGTLTFLYRLLFLLYAESRDLLPVREVRGYHEGSLECLRQDVAAAAGTVEDAAPARIRAAFADDASGLYERLTVLFAAVDRGSRALNVPVYNGGLFLTAPDPADPSPEAAAARFLAATRIPDRDLALGLDRLARDRDEKTHGLVPIDYKSLGVRQLGSIYEGLLEFKLRVAGEPLALVRGKKTEEIVPLAEARRTGLAILKEGHGKAAPERVLEPGAVYLANDRRERKASGSYYTPDYIVKYIVCHTVGPVLDARLAALRPAFQAAQQTRQAEQHKAAALRARGQAGDSPDNQAYLKHRAAVVEPFFDLKVLDPAMGSGHFLVEAVDYITDRFVTFLRAFPWNPVYHGLALLREDIRAAMDAQGVTSDPGKLTDLNLLKRQVLKRCIYGVDLNPMAVELAKVSLWLDCFTLGAPLSFLDHHLKPGNSLIGGSVGEVQEALSRDLFGYQFAGLLNATQLMRHVGELSDVTAAEVAESRKAYHGAADALAPFKRLLDVWLSPHFGNKGARQTASVYAAAIIANDYTGTNAPDQQAIATAATLARDKHFFHWELEFPEVFYDQAERKPDGGFDAVIGNPPYVRQEGLGSDKAVFQAAYKVYNSIADLYTYFIERGHTLLRPNGRFGMITANKFMRANYGGPLREFLTTSVCLEELIDFGDLPVFGDATTYPVVILSSKRQRAGAGIQYALVPNLDFAQLSQAFVPTNAKLPDSAFAGSNWSLAAASEQSILDKLKGCSIPLGEHGSGRIQYGVKTGYNAAFFINRATRNNLIAEDQRSAEIIKPLILGEDVRRYDIEFEDIYLIFTRRGIDIRQYPAVERYLLQYRTRLEPRPATWDSQIQGDWPGRKPGSYKWYEIQDNVAYYADFEKPKIVFPDIAKEVRFAFDDTRSYTGNTSYIIPTGDLFLLTILNARLTTFFFQSLSAVFRGGYLRFFDQYMEEIPIRRIAFTTPPDRRAALASEGRALYTRGLADGDPAGALAFVDAQLAQQPEAADIVHDLLAALAEAMIRLNQEKRAAQQAFLAWLVALLQVRPAKDGQTGLAALTGKSALADYSGDYQKGAPPLAADDLLAILAKNRTRLEARLTDSAMDGAIRAAYVASLARVLPLKAQLAATDRLIDAIVYRLYGLTAAEIAVVEGHAN